MSYFFISKQLLWELFFRISTSKGKTIETTIGAGKEYTVSLEDHSIYMLVYYELGNGNINDGSVNCAVIVSRQADEKIRRNIYYCNFQRRRYISGKQYTKNYSRHLVG